MTTMKALTMWQPWASLIAVGAKRIETRSWSTEYRGPLLIHAAKNSPDSALHLAGIEPFRSALEDGGIEKFWSLPSGVIVARCELVACRQIRDSIDLPGKPEVEFGDYSVGRWMWILKNVVRIPKPWPARGHMKLWDCELPEPMFWD